jgi:hypothetical protein
LTGKSGSFLGANNASLGNPPFDSRWHWRPGLFNRLALLENLQLGFMGMRYDPETGLGVVEMQHNPHGTNRFQHRQLLPVGSEIIEQIDYRSCVFCREILGRMRHFLIVASLTTHAKQDIQFSITELAYP